MALATLGALCLVYLATGCNENFCASDVSKCQLLGACSCSLSNCSCCANCTRCLGDLWADCCTCMGLCPARNNSHKGGSAVSTVANLMPLTSLFDALTEMDVMPDPRLKWKVLRIPHTEEDINHLKPAADRTNGKKSETDTGTMTTATPETIEEEEGECVVVYMDECLSLGKCEDACSSMGATRQRWFHDGCCECVGHTCMAYGKPISQCKRCPKVGKTEL